MVKDMGQAHHHNFFCGLSFTVEERLEWLVAYRQIRRSLTKDKFLSDVDNLLQLVLHDFYTARLYPLQTSFLTAATLYFQSGDSIINPSMLTKYPLGRERFESYNTPIGMLFAFKNLRTSRGPGREEGGYSSMLVWCSPCGRPQPECPLGGSLGWA